MSVVLSESQTVYSIWFDKELATSHQLTGSVINNDADIYIGRGIPNHRIGVLGCRYDNLQIFNKPLSINELEILALAN